MMFKASLGGAVIFFQSQRFSAKLGGKEGTNLRSLPFSTLLNCMFVASRGCLKLATSSSQKNKKLRRSSIECQEKVSSKSVRVSSKSVEQRVSVSSRMQMRGNREKKAGNICKDCSIAFGFEGSIRFLTFGNHNRF